jgi:hypothetical protein
MSERVSFDDRADDFRVDIRWAGAQDKPYYRATLVSESRRGTVAEQLFHGVAVIRPDELKRLLAALEEQGVTLAPGRREGDDLNEYVIEVTLGDQELSGSLGDERRSIPILTSVRDALDDEHRGPLDDVLRRLEGWTHA